MIQFIFFLGMLLQLQDANFLIFHKYLFPKEKFVASIG